MCDSRQPSDGADSGWGHTDVESKTILINPMWHPDLHVCTKEDCGHECHWEGGVPLYSFHINIEIVPEVEPVPSGFVKVRCARISGSGVFVLESFDQIKG